MKIKVCGMKHNISEVAACLPDYLGFIFYKKSSRNFSGTIPELPPSIEKVGIFVDASIKEVVSIVHKYGIHIIQLHGEESPTYCDALRQEMNPSKIELWKVFSVSETFNFDQLHPYEDAVDTFLFDTSGNNKGGNGITFNWNLLHHYPSQKPFILSGGIGLDEMEAVHQLARFNLPLFAIDVNSKLEDAPGQKNISQLQQLMKQL